MASDNPGGRGVSCMYSRGEEFLVGVIRCEQYGTECVVDILSSKNVLRNIVKYK